MEETVLLLRRMAEQGAERGHGQAAAILEQQARETQRRAALVRQAVMQHEKLGNGQGAQSGQKP